jgi:hypothetical protein
MVTDTPPPVRASRYTRNVVPKQSMNAMAGTAKLPKAAPSPKAMARDAPKAAPEDTPSTDGEAIGFLKRPCMARPEMERAAPTRAQQRIRGTLISRIMYTWVSSPMPNIIIIAS